MSNLTKLITKITKPGTYQPIPGMGDKLVDYLVAAHYDCDWEGFKESEKQAFEILAKDMLIFIEHGDIVWKDKESIHTAKGGGE